MVRRLDEAGERRRDVGQSPRVEGGGTAPGDQVREKETWWHRSQP